MSLSNISRANLAASTVFHRLLAGMTQIELAAAAGVSVGTIRRIEEGESDAIRLDTIARLACALNLSVTLTAIAHDAKPEPATPEKAQFEKPLSAPLPDTPRE